MFLGQGRSDRLGLHHDARNSPSACFYDRLNAVDAARDLFAIALQRVVRFVSPSHLAFALGMRNLDNHLDFHTGAEWDLRPTKGGAGMCSALAKYFAKKF
jgi:hypothetical protein